MPLTSRFLIWCAVYFLSIGLQMAAKAEAQDIDSIKLHAEQGDEKAELQLGVAYYKGQGVPQSYVEAVSWYRKAAAQGDPQAQFLVGFAYELGQGVAKDDTQATIWYQKAAEQDWPDAEYLVGTRYAIGLGVKQDYIQSTNWYNKAAEQGFAKAQLALGIAYALGKGVPLDYERATSLFAKAADQGMPQAQLDLGLSYAAGLGITQDDTLAAVWYRKAADQGLAEAQFSLGNDYGKGRGVPQDYSLAASWLRRAADQGLAKAQLNLGLAYDRGQGVPQDYTEAGKWLRKAANQGLAPAEWLLGNYYSRGLGVPQDTVQAASLIKSASDHGYAPVQPTSNSKVDTQSLGHDNAQNKAPNNEQSLVVCKEPQNCSHRFVSDAMVKILSANGITIAIKVLDDGHNLQAEVGIVNSSSQPIDVIPSSFSMRLLEPKERELRYQSPETVIRSASNRAGWTNFFVALGSASATQRTTIQTNSTTNGNVSAFVPGGVAFGNYNERSSSTSTITTPDYQARQNAANYIAANNAAVMNVAQNISSFSLRATTIDPGQSAQGTVYFERVRNAKTTVVRIPINGIVYQFTFGG